MNVSGIVVTAAFVEGNEDRGVLPQRGIRLHRVNDLLGEAFEQVELGRGRVAVHEPAGLDEGNGGKVAVSDVRIQV